MSVKSEKDLWRRVIEAMKKDGIPLPDSPEQLAWFAAWCRSKSFPALPVKPDGTPFSMYDPEAYLPMLQQPAVDDLPAPGRA